MRLSALLLVLALAACGAGQDEHFHLVTIEARDGMGGLTLRELPRSTLSSLGLAYGLAVVKVGAAGERAGLRLGDVIFGVNQRRLRSLEDFGQALWEPDDGRVNLLVRRGQRDLALAVELEALPPEGGRLRGPRRATDTLLRT